MKKTFSKSKYKKGSGALDLLIFVAVFVVFILVAFFSSYIFREINTGFQADDDFGTEAKAMMQTQSSQHATVFDNAAFLFLVSMWIGVLVLSFLIDSHPIFFAVMFFLLIFSFVILALLGNIYEELTSDAEFAVIQPLYAKSNWIMSHILETGIIVGFSIILVLYGKQRLGA